MHTMRTFALMVSLFPPLPSCSSVCAKDSRGTDRFVSPPQLALVLAYDAAIAFAAYEAAQGDTGHRKLLLLPQQQPTMPGEAIGNAVGTFVTNAGGMINGAMDMLWPVATGLWEPVQAFSY